MTCVQKSNSHGCRRLACTHIDWQMGLVGTAGAEHAMRFVRTGDDASLNGSSGGGGSVGGGIDAAMEQLPHWFPIRKLSDEECVPLPSAEDAGTAAT